MSLILYWPSYRSGSAATGPILNPLINNIIVLLISSAYYLISSFFIILLNNHYVLNLCNVGYFSVLCAYRIDLLCFHIFLYFYIFTLFLSNVIFHPA